MSEITVKRTWARWAFAAAGAGITALAVAGPAAADGQVGVNVTGAVSAAGQVVLSGQYSCDPAVAPYAEISVAGAQADGYGGEVQATTYDRVACTGTAQAWQETLTSRHASEWYGAGVLWVDVNVWTPGGWNDRAEAAQWVWVS